MGTASQYLEKLKFVKNTIIDETHAIIERNAEKIADLNAEEQLMKHGINIHGNLLGTYKTTRDGETRGYPKIKGRPYNFFDTGALFDSFWIITRGAEMEITNTDYKVPILEEMSGEFIGLTKENKAIVNWDIIYPELMDYINKHL